ncbi:NBS-LRR type disease resistance protein [Trifolium medium]|uniref:NBS-LRR type disease resistance protein n=1 Tax=Trifolium medium TaxID=97028 RepID=A0A392M6D0_9FABA|nr:NBS-LRR type disease resistance protein [Trifolium medium]
MMDIFNAGKTGSTIIITTRDEIVARSFQIVMCVHYLRPLESKDCWSLITRHAFGECEDQQQSNLEEIGRKIAKKCDGLPLAAVKVAALLRTKLSPNDLNYVLGDNILELIVFPKKAILEKKRVVQLWIAEGLVDSSTGQAGLEKDGEEYFDILVSRSLIQRRSTDDEEASFEMNNLIHDLATMVSSPYCIRLDEQIIHEKAVKDSLNYPRTWENWLIYATLTLVTLH